jgi:hypothetical protein
MVAGMVAAVTAVLTAGLLLPPRLWAAVAPVEVPALPSQALEIPDRHLLVTATATPDPGQPVQVALAVKSSRGRQTPSVPVTVTVMGTTMETFSRVMPAPKQVTKVDATVLVAPDGSGTATVTLPLVWAAPKKPAIARLLEGKQAGEKNVAVRQVTTSYFMVLSSPLGGKPAPAMLQVIDQAAPRRAW